MMIMIMMAMMLMMMLTIITIRYVLGLSQGTVSELLSKPKSWDKLTEKGRDSYRKMHAWVWDDQVNFHNDDDAQGHQSLCGQSLSLSFSGNPPFEDVDSKKG